MAGHRKFSELQAALPAERRARNQAAADAVLAETTLAGLRQVQGVTQVDLAERFPTTQSEVSKIENRGDVLISTLRRYVAALDGRLEIVAHLANGSVRITQFYEADDMVDPQPSPRMAAATRRKRAVG
jgi:transcriptional regulator with XRE-family HTH domain